MDAVAIPHKHRRRSDWHHSTFLTDHQRTKSNRNGQIFTMLGVRKISNSCLDTASDLFLNSQPKTGIRDIYGTPWTLLFWVSTKTPPITMVSPSRTSTWVLASRRSILGPAGLLLAPTAFRVARTRNRIRLASSLGSREVICGVTFSSKLASTNVVCVPCKDVVWNGIDSP